MIEVVRSGLLTTVQDLGRFGYEAAGVSPSGAMDTVLAELANAIVGNDKDAAVLELTWVGPQLTFTEEAWISICGADMQAKVDGTLVPRNRLIQVSAGAKLTFATAKHGARSVLAVAGGIDVPVILGSRNTHVHAKLGGYDGRPLQPGDVLKLCIPSEATAMWLRKQPMHPSGASVRVSSWELRIPREVDGGLNENGSEQVIRIIPGPEFLWFADDVRQMLTEAEYEVTQSSNRMGYRLAGMPLIPERKEHLWSSAVTFGTVQVPPDGQPVVLMAERQTTGGYPRIGVVASVDRPRLAQLRPGHRLKFTWIDVNTAQQLLIRQRKIISQLKTLLRYSGGVS
ncbi:biotin-dependent carboxyltransferase family protein [Alicyclobacillus curvatus]|nr:biotin-dependent carboxyltransferase family protein [Alicyclobacillus curvatus]